MANKLLKVLCSLPFILVLLYFFPFGGICFLIIRYFVYPKTKILITPIILGVVSLILFIPKIIDTIIVKFKLSSITFIQQIIDNSIYKDLLKFSKKLFIIAVVFLLVSLIFKKVVESANNKINEAFSTYIDKSQKQEREISAENDLKMKEKREKAKNTHAVICPYCGADNLIVGNSGTCSYCRRKITYKEK